MLWSICVCFSLGEGVCPKIIGWVLTVRIYSDFIVYPTGSWLLASLPNSPLSHNELTGGVVPG